MEWTTAKLKYQSEDPELTPWWVVMPGQFRSDFRRGRSRSWLCSDLDDGFLDGGNLAASYRGWLGVGGGGITNSRPRDHIDTHSALRPRRADNPPDRTSRMEFPLKKYCPALLLSKFFHLFLPAVRSTPTPFTDLSWPPPRAQGVSKSCTTNATDFLGGQLDVCSTGPWTQPLPTLLASPASEAPYDESEGGLTGGPFTIIGSDPGVSATLAQTLGVRQV